MAQVIFDSGNLAMFYYSSFRVLFLATFSIIFFSFSSQADYQATKPITIYNPSDSVKQITPLPKRNIGLFFDKLRAHKPVTVAYLGGSVIAGVGASNPEKSSCRALISSWL